MGKLVKFSVTLLTGLCVGGLSALLMSGVIGKYRPSQDSTINIQGWIADWAIGTKATSPYMRAYVARHGIFALPKTEAVYFIRRTDDKGEQLQEQCTYLLSGEIQGAQWWSITLYDETDFLPLNTDLASSIDQTKITTKKWSAIIQSTRPTLQEGTSWLSSKNAGDFDLTLRLYRPNEALLLSPEKAFRPPSIKRMRCDENTNEAGGL